MNQKVDWAPVFDADRRPVERVGFDALNNVGAQLNAYGLHANETLTFEPGTTVENIQVAKQAPRREGQRFTLLVACLINGAKTWINPMFFLRTKRVNNQNVPIYPEWAKLGDAAGVVSQLIKQGGITAGEDVMVPMAAFEQDGSAKYVPKVDEAGNKIVKEDGSYELIRDTNDRPYPILPNPVIG